VDECGVRASLVASMYRAGVRRGVGCGVCQRSHDGGEVSDTVIVAAILFCW
jgi:hypothetical protein